MFSWPDVVVVVVLLVVALVGGATGWFDAKSIAALIAAATGFVGARAASKLRKKNGDKTSSTDGQDAVPEVHEHETSGVIEVAPPPPGRRVEVHADGHVTIGPAADMTPFDLPPEESARTSAADGSKPR